jgi:predicted adenylyl cyclase CyaB
LNQTDTYFHPRDASRLKLRQINNDRAELITYTRPNTPSARTSLYKLDPISNPQATLLELTQSLGVLCVVRKRRELFLWQNVRIHLDQVEDLGPFLEFEGVVSPQANESLSRARVDHLVQEFAITPDHQIGVSYSDLLCLNHETTK